MIGLLQLVFDKGHIAIAINGQDIDPKVADPNFFLLVLQFAQT